MGDLGLLIDLLYLAYESTFGRFGSLFHFILAWIVLFYPPLYMGVAMIKGTQNYISLLFWHGA